MLITATKPLLTSSILDFNRDDAAVFDIETDGYLGEMTRLHCIAIYDHVQGYRLYDTLQGNLLDGLEQLRKYKHLFGHNIGRFDLPALYRLGVLTPDQTSSVGDTLVYTHLLAPKPESTKHLRTPHSTTQTDSHSLKAWGQRLGVFKGEYGAQKGFKTYSQEMGDYCLQDVKVNVALLNYLLTHADTLSALSKAVELETDQMRWLGIMEVQGVPIAGHKIGKLVKDLTVSAEEALKAITYHRIKPEPKAKQSKYAVRFTSSPLNPGSFTDKDWIFDRYKLKKPVKPEFDPVTKTTVMKVSYGDGALERYLHKPAIAQLNNCLVYNKTLATLNGKKGVLACLTQNTYGDGRIHPSVNPFGTTTYRCSHGNPNINFPSVKVDEKTGQMVTGVSGKYGAEIRGLVEAPDGWVLMGADAAGLELRALGAVLLPTDGGAVLRDVLEGDIHETNANFYNLTLSKHGFTLVTRKSGKAVSYGIMYGSGTAKLAFVLGCSIDCAKEIILKLRKKWALDKFMAQCKQEIEEHHGHLLGLDGRYIYLRSPHASLNYKLQSTGSLLCKKAMNLFIHNMLKAGFVYGDDFQVVLFVHDEIQVLVREPIVEQAKLICRDSFYEGGRYYNIPFPLDSEIKIGKNWAETH